MILIDKHTGVNRQVRRDKKVRGKKDTGRHTKAERLTEKLTESINRRKERREGKGSDIKGKKKENTKNRRKEGRK